MPTRDELLSDIKAELAEAPCVDLHSHLRWYRPQARDLAEMVFYHFLNFEMIAAGMPRAVCDIEDPRRKLHAALPWLDLVRHTGTAYGLRRILQDLYGMREDWIGPDNVDALFDRVREHVEDAEWPRQVQRRGKLATVFVSNKQRHDGTPDAADFARYDDLFTAALETGFQYDEGFGAGLGRSNRRKRKNPPAARRRPLPETLEEFVRRPYADWPAADWGGLKACLGWTSTDFRWEPADLYAERVAYGKLRGGSALDKAEINRLRLALMRAMLDDCRAKGVGFQIFYGSIYGPSPAPPHPTNVVYDQETFANFAGLASEYEDVHMTLLLGNILNSQEACIMTKMRPNVHCAGIWWHSMYPAYIRRMLAERLDVCPLNKVALLFSDAYMSEWCYGKRKLVEREFALMLAEKVHDGYLSRADASRVARMWMLENPVKWYGLDLKLTF